MKVKEINLFTWLARLNKDCTREYDLQKEICYFPETDEYKGLVDISDQLNNKAIFLKHKEGFDERKAICESDEEWKAFVNHLKRKYNYTCQISGMGLNDIKLLSEKIFGLKPNDTWINNWLTPHHIDSKTEYKCFDENKLIICNRAIHLAYHRRYYIDAFIKRPVTDYSIYFEIGSLIHDRNGIYPWRNITERKEYDTAYNWNMW